MKTSRLSRKVTCWAAFLVVGMLVLPFLIIEKMRQQVRGGTERFAFEVQALRADGIPVTPEGFQRPLPSPERNAAPDYLQLTALLKSQPIPKDVLYPERVAKTGLLKPQQEQGLRALIAQRRTMMELIHRAAKKPECVFKRDWSLGPAMPLDELGPMRTATRLIWVESYLMARDGRYSEAVANQALGFHIAEQAGSDALYIGYLVAINIDAVTVAGMEQILRIAGPNEAVDRQVERAIAAHSPRIELANGMKGEIANSLAIDQGIRTHGIAYCSPDEHGKVLGAVGSIALNGKQFDRELADATIAELIHYERLLFEAASLPVSKRHSAIRQVVNEIHRRFDRPASHKNLSLIPAAILLPLFGQGPDRLDKVRTRRSICMAAASVLAYRSVHHFFPRTLGEAGIGASALDTTGNPLSYRREGSGFVVYSAQLSPSQIVSGVASGKDGLYFRYP